MTNDLKRAKCLEANYNLIYINNPNLFNSGRYIKALKRYYSLSKNENEKTKYEFAINRLLQKHLYFLQESIIKGYGLSSDYKITKYEGEQLTAVVNGEFAIQTSKYSFVDVDMLKQLQVIKKTVNLKDDLVLPIKVKTERGTKLVTQIIVSKNNVLAYSTNNYEEDTSAIIHNVVLSKKGKGITHNELINDKIKTMSNGGLR